MIKELPINGQIRDKEVRLINDKTGEQLGVVSIHEAQRLADEAGLDLVKFSSAEIPVCKILDYSKYIYEQKKKEKEIKKNQKIVEVKEVWLSMTIDIGDLKTIANKAAKFLADGNKVKPTIRMRGRQQAYAQQGVDVMMRFAELLSDCAKIEKQPVTEGRNISMVLAPLTNK